MKRLCKKTVAEKRYITNNAKRMVYVQDVGKKLKALVLFTAKCVEPRCVNGGDKKGKILIVQKEHHMVFATSVERILSCPEKVSA